MNAKPKQLQNYFSHPIKLQLYWYPFRFFFFSIRFSVFMNIQRCFLACLVPRPLYFTSVNPCGFTWCACGHPGDVAGESGSQKEAEVLPNSIAITLKLK